MTNRDLPLDIEEEVIFPNRTLAKGAFEFLSSMLEQYESVSILSQERGRLRGNLGILERVWREELRTHGKPEPKPIVPRIRFAALRTSKGMLVGKRCVNVNSSLPAKL